MLTTYGAALCFLLASVLAGQCLTALTGRREGWSVAPAAGLAALLCVGGLASRLPERPLLIALLPGLVLAAAAVVAVLRRPPWPPLPALCAAGVALLVAALPFYVAGRSGLLGVSLNNDTAVHLVWAEALRSDRMADLYPLPDGYPIAPHALMAALAAVSGIAMDEVLNGLLIATAALTALAAWPLLARLPVAARVAGAVLVAFAYLPAAYFGQGAFKETMFALLIVAFAAVLAEARGARRPWIEAGVPAGLIAAGGVQVYSYLALGWFGAIAVAWLVLELALGGPRDVGARVRGALPAVGLAIAAAGAVLVVGLAAQVDRLASFANVFSVSPAGAGGGIGVTDLGNLAGKLSAYEGLGVWPSPDFRFAPGNAFHAGELAAVALVVVVVGTVVALRRREAALVGAAAAVLAIYWVSDRTQSPYVAAKALVLAAPLVMALALAAWPSERRGWMDGTLARMALVGVFVLGAAYSSSLALRAAPVASQEQERELDALRPLVGNERTLFLGSDDHIAWLLRGVNIGSPQISAQRTAIAVPLRAEKPPITNQPFDFDSIGERTLDSFAYVIAPRSGYDSEPPPNFTRVRSGRLYELWRRTGATPPRETIEPGDAPGALLDCRRSAGRAISRDGGSATVWAAVPQIAKGGLPIAPGAAADLSIPLTRGRWVLSLQYTSTAPVRAVSRRGSWSLPAKRRARGPTSCSVRSTSPSTARSACA